MKKQKVWHYAVYVNGKKIRQMTIANGADRAEEEAIRQSMESLASARGGRVTKGFTLK